VIWCELTNVLISGAKALGAGARATMVIDVDGISDPADLRLASTAAQWDLLDAIAPGLRTTGLAGQAGAHLQEIALDAMARAGRDDHPKEWR
jgi:hypothetical protein